MAEFRIGCFQALQGVVEDEELFRGIGDEGDGVGQFHVELQCAALFGLERAGVVDEQAADDDRGVAVEVFAGLPGYWGCAEQFGVGFVDDIGCLESFPIGWPEGGAGQAAEFAVDTAQ